MNPLRRLKKLLAVSFLLVFVLTIEAFCYPLHIINELGHVHKGEPAVHLCKDACSAALSIPADADHHDGKGTHNEDGGVCCHEHSHAFILFHTTFISHSSSVSLCRFVEPFKFIPEVFLDKFIPPQNLA